VNFLPPLVFSIPLHVEAVFVPTLVLGGELQLLLLCACVVLLPLVLPLIDCDDLALASLLQALLDHVAALQQDQHI